MDKITVMLRGTVSDFRINNSWYVPKILVILEDFMGVEVHFAFKAEMMTFIITIKKGCCWNKME